ncbi:hypothetical protein AB0958_28425 [Streptomyces sp. NPDC006655]|uniref:hypothetical protein n=1 Tax=Streptomyces sp. NPDC006655 TaxID=3156898 RepID=UPI00345167D0
MATPSFSGLRLGRIPRVTEGVRPRWGKAAAAVAAAGAICLVEAGPAAAIDSGAVVDCKHNPNALQNALSNAQPGATLRIQGVCFGNFVINTNLTLIGLGCVSEVDLDVSRSTSWGGTI